MKFETVDGKRYKSCRFSEHQKSDGEQCDNRQCPEKSMDPLFLVDNLFYDLRCRRLDELWNRR